MTSYILMQSHSKMRERDRERDRDRQRDRQTERETDRESGIVLDSERSMMINMAF